MQRHTGNAGAETWARGERILSLSRQLQRLPQPRLLNRDSNPAPVALKNTYSHARTVLLAPATNTALTANSQGVEVQTQVMAGQVVNFIYHPPSDLSLEGE